MGDEERSDEPGEDGRWDSDTAESQEQSKVEARTQWAEERTHMADYRTDWALERTVLASERTLSAWLRTGLTAMAAGIGIARLLTSVHLPWLARAIGAILIVAGAVAIVVGLWRYQGTTGKLEHEGMGRGPRWLVRGMALALLVATALAILLLFLPL